MTLIVAAMFPFQYHAVWKANSFRKQSPENMGNRGTRFLRKVWESEEGQARIPCVNVASANKYDLHNSISSISIIHLPTISLRLALHLLRLPIQIVRLPPQLVRLSLNNLFILVFIKAVNGFSLRTNLPLKWGRFTKTGNDSEEGLTVFRTLNLAS